MVTVVTVIATVQLHPMVTKREVQCADKVTTVLYLTKTLVVETSYIAIIALVLLRECSPLTTVDI